MRKLGLVAAVVASLAMWTPATIAAASAPVRSSTTGSVASYTDPSGDVLDSSGNVVANPAADARTATASDNGTTVSVSLSTYGVTNPSTDPGWNTNTPSDTYTFVAWDIVTSTGHDYLAYFETNATAGAPEGTLAGEVDSITSTGQFQLSCTVTPAYSTSVGYQLSFPSRCLGTISTFKWYAFIVYHPSGDPDDYYLAKAAPEQPPFPTAANTVYAPTVKPTTPPPALPPGYWFSASDGGVFTFGKDRFYGSTGNIKLNKPVVGMARTPDGKGYWLVASDGGIFAFGDAHFYGSTGNLVLDKPVVGMAPTPDGGGYWLVASDGGIFTFGDAKFYGSTGGIALNKPVVGIASTPDGKGYWLVATDGGIFNYGDAKFHGSTGGITLNKPVVGIAATSDGLGYWLVASDGGIFSFGDAKFHGSTGGITLNKPVVGIASTYDGLGYWLVATDGGIFSYGDAKFYGSTGGIALARPIVGMAST